MDSKLQEQLDEQEIKINQIHESVMKTERYMRFTFWTTIVVFALPLLIAVFAIPAIISSFSSTMGDLQSLGL